MSQAARRNLVADDRFMIIEQSRQKPAQGAEREEKMEKYNHHCRLIFIY